MNHNYKVVYRCWNEPEAQMLKGLLESYGVKPRLVSHVPHSVYPFNVDGLGEIRITVPKEYGEKAKQIIEAYQDKSGQCKEE